MSVTAVLGNLICSGIILLIIGFGVFNFIKYLIGLVRHPEVKQKFPFFAFIVIAFFAMSILIGIIMTFSGSVPASPAPFPTARPVATRLSPTPRAVLPTLSRPTCLEWDKVTASMDGKTICVYGVVTDHVENFDAQQTFFYFGGRDKFFFTSLERWNFAEDVCVSATGKIQLNTYKTPYMKVDQVVGCSDNDLSPSVGSVPTSVPKSSYGSSPLVNVCPDGCEYPKAGCHIKGNISIDTGEKIFYVPGQELYSLTTVNSTNGERWFCTEDEARSAGWSKAEN